MSGPKTSRYTLTAEQRRQLALRREREVKRQAEKKKIDQWKTSFSFGATGFDKEADRAAVLQKREKDDCGWSAAMKKLNTEVENAIRTLNLINDASSLEECQQANEEASRANARISTLRSELMSIDHKVSFALDKSVAVDVDKGFSVSVSFASRKAETDCKEKAESCLMQLLSLRKKDLSVLLYEEIDRAMACLQNISGADFLKSFQAVTIDPLTKKCAIYIKTQEKNKERYRELMPLYEALCDEANIAPNQFTATEASIQLLEVEIERIKVLVADMEEQAYISQCIDEAMEELGYELIGDRVVTKRSGKRFRNELYLFAEGTAVNVTYASDGRITMELGGMDSVDRVPTVSEAERMRADMEEFCGEYHKLELLLQKKGVVSKHISLLPPSEECAMIINTSDYNMTATAPEAKKQTKKRAEGKLQRSI